MERRSAACSGMFSKRPASTRRPLPLASESMAAPAPGLSSSASSCSSTAVLPALSVFSRLDAANNDSPVATIDSPSSSPPF